MLVSVPAAVLYASPTTWSSGENVRVRVRFTPVGSTVAVVTRPALSMV